MAKEQIVHPAITQTKTDVEIVLDAVLAELDRANPAWRTRLPAALKQALARRTIRRGS